MIHIFIVENQVKPAPVSAKLCTSIMLLLQYIMRWWKKHDANIIAHTYSKMLAPVWHKNLCMPIENWNIKMNLAYTNPLKGRGVNWLHFAIQV